MSRRRAITEPILAACGPAEVVGTAWESESNPPFTPVGSGEYALDDDNEVLARGTQTGEDDHRLGPLEEFVLARGLHRRPTRRVLPTDGPILQRSFDRALRSLYMCFQPIVRCDGVRYGFEALLRPNDLVIDHPVALLEAAEILGRVEQLGRVIRLRVAEAFMARARSDLRLFVNLHAADLMDRSLLSPLAPLSRIATSVVLEITERTSLEQMTGIRERIAELRELGFRIAIDDFGAGCSRMRTLTPVDCDYVKLDQSLVRDVDSNADKRHLVQSIAERCHRHDIQVVGEGVETRGEHEALLELGCDLLQGFLYGHPGPSLP